MFCEILLHLDYEVIDFEKNIFSSSQREYTGYERSLFNFIKTN